MAKYHINSKIANLGIFQLAKLLERDSENFNGQKIPHQ